MATVPVALSKRGVRMASEVKQEDGPFECLECSEELILKAVDSELVRVHFSHLAARGSCGGGGGESVTHAYAKRLIAVHLHLWRFAADVGRELVSFLKECTAYEELVCGVFRLDVGVKDSQGVTIAAIEVKKTHAVDDAKFDTLERSKVRVFEVDADEVIDAFIKGKLRVSFVNRDAIRVANAAREAERVREEERRAYRAAQHAEHMRSVAWMQTTLVSSSYEKRPSTYKKSAAQSGKKQTVPKPVAPVDPEDQRIDAELKTFDLNPSYGPRMSITRMARYNRAVFLKIPGLDPKIKTYLEQFPDKNITC